MDSRPASRFAPFLFFAAAFSLSPPTLAPDFGVRAERFRHGRPAGSSLSFIRRFQPHDSSTTYFIAVLPRAGRQLSPSRRPARTFSSRRMHAGTHSQRRARSSGSTFSSATPTALRIETSTLLLCRIVGRPRRARTSAGPTAPVSARPRDRRATRCPRWSRMHSVLYEIDADGDGDEDVDRLHARRDVRHGAPRLHAGHAAARTYACSIAGRSRPRRRARRSATFRPGTRFSNSSKRSRRRGLRWGAAAATTAPKTR